MIEAIAARQGNTPETVRQEIQAAIDAAWDNKTDRSSAAWRNYFPDGRKPSVEKFVLRLAEIGDGKTI